MTSLSTNTKRIIQQLSLLQVDKKMSHLNTFSSHESVFFQELHQLLIETATSNINDRSEPSIIPIYHPNEIPKPDSTLSVPTEILATIHSKSIFKIKVHYQIFEDREITLHIIFMKGWRKKHIMDFLNFYLPLIFQLLQIMNAYSTIKKDKPVKSNIYLYLTDDKKKLPRDTSSSSSSVLYPIHVNSGYSTVVSSDIVIFRYEEWFKVLIHEVIHSFQLDFSQMNTTIQKARLQKVFKIQSEFEVNESYVECFAVLINIAFSSYYNYETKTKKDYLNHCRLMLFYEKIFSIHQSLKILDYYGLSYRDLYEKTTTSIQTNMQEKTNTFAYFIVKTIFLVHVDSFLSLCRKQNDGNILSFTTTQSSLDTFFSFILNKCNSKHMLRSIDLYTFHYDDNDNTTRFTCIEMA